MKKLAVRCQMIKIIGLIKLYWVSYNKSQYIEYILRDNDGTIQSEKSFFIKFSYLRVRFYS